MLLHVRYVLQTRGVGNHPPCPPGTRLNHPDCLVSVHPAAHRRCRGEVLLRLLACARVPVELPEAEVAVICSPIELRDGAILLRQYGRSSWASSHGSRMADASSPW